MFAVKGYAGRASLPQTSSWTSAHAQGYFSATVLIGGSRVLPGRLRVSLRREGLAMESAVERNVRSDRFG